MDKAAGTLLRAAIKYHRAGDLNEAAGACQQLLKEDSCNAEALYLLGLVALQKGKLGESAELLSQAIEFKPGEAVFHCNLGTALIGLGKHSEALEQFTHAVAINPNLPAAHYNRGNVFQLLGLYVEAEASYRCALKLRGSHPDSLNNLGSLLQESGRLAEAHHCFETALQLSPNSPELHVNMGNNLKHQSRVEEAIVCYRRALELSPNFYEAQSNLLFALSTFQTCTPEEYRLEAERYGQMVTKGVQQKFTHSQSNKGSRRRSLRLGFVSGDLKLHPVGYFIENVLKEINLNNFQLYAYTTRDHYDELTERIRPYFSGWRTIANSSDKEAASLINDDQIDVLLDLSGHTSGNRLALFAWKPAPVQVSWLGYFASTGVAEIDYVLADLVAVPINEDAQYTEAVWRMPVTRLCFSTPTVDIPVSTMPAGLNGFITFGCQQSLAKLSDTVLAVWAQIFRQLPTARLRLQSKQLCCADTSINLSKRITDAGISRDRVDLLGPLNRNDYLRGYEQIDVCLDTFPYPGGTTTCEALWMGVPTLTLAGETMLSRQGVSIMMAVNLKEFIAQSHEEYVKKAVEFGRDPTSLSNLRQHLRNRAQESALFDSVRFARDFGDAIIGMSNLRLQGSEE
jgi:predicted O-linked N-acetylglucosamine transferase (SPINDLY family)